MSTFTKKSLLFQMLTAIKHSLTFNKYKFVKKDNKEVNLSFLNFEVKDEIEEELMDYEEVLFFNHQLAV